MSDKDPDRAMICLELHSFTSFLNIIIDQVLYKGSPFHSFRRLLDQHVTDIREEGYTDLADSFVADLSHLEQELQELKEL